MKLTTKEFVKRAKEIHGDIYGYSLVDYKNIDTKVIIICPEHGKFEQIPYHHLKGHKCKYCKGVNTGTSESFIVKAKEIHGNTYNYSLVNYINRRTKVVIVCSKHGKFKQNPGDHLTGKGCLSCCVELRSLTQEEFVARASKLHNEKYDYSKVNYKHNLVPVIIICPKHGEFKQAPNCHIYSLSGCPICNSSRGEKKIYNWLKEKNIIFKTQVKFKDCKNVRSLPFDFGVIINKKLTLIEFQGEHHYRPVSFGSKNKHLDIFNKTQINDNIKKGYCQSKGYKLIEIPFDCKDIDSLLQGIYE